MTGSVRSTTPIVLLVLVATGVGTACGRHAPTAGLTPEYDARSGRLTRLRYDADRDGRAEMTASMDGGHLQTVEVDHNRDGLPDRFEFYAQPRPGAPANATPVLVRVEEVTRRGTVVVRREGYVAGALVWVREDRDADGRDDRWDVYEHGGLATVDLDTNGSGRPDRRLRYTGDTVTVEIDRADLGESTPKTGR